MATKKTTAEQVKVAMAKVEAAKAAETTKTEEKAPAKKVAAKTTKTAEKKTAAKTEEKTSAKKAVAKTTKAAEKKTTAAKTVEKKAAPAKKAPAKTAIKVTETVVIQACGYEVTTADITAKVVDIVGKKVKELNIYVKPEEGMVYYTADGEQGSVAL